MSSTDKLSAAVPTTETTIYSASDLDHDGILAVANNVTLALESEALFINGMPDLIADNSSLQSSSIVIVHNCLRLTSSPQIQQSKRTFVTAGL